MATKKKFIQVEESYIKQIHSEVCDEWQEKLENKFPTIFPQKYIDFNRPFTTIKGDKCIIIKNPLNKTKVTLLWSDGEEALDVTDHLRNGKITQKAMSEDIHEAFVKYL